MPRRDQSVLALLSQALALVERARAMLEPEDLPGDHLSPHFTLSEFIASDTAAMQGIDNTPDDAALLSAGQR